MFEALALEVFVLLLHEYNILQFTIVWYTVTVWFHKCATCN
jgi:hypothetical protein